MQAAKIDGKLNSDSLIARKLLAFGTTQSELANVARYIESKYETFSGLSDVQRAHKYWETTLKNEQRINVRQSQECEFVIVIPVYDETPQRIFNQIESLRYQHDLRQEQFEIIYIVNNDVVKDDAESHRIANANQKILSYLKAHQDKNIFVIDKSSPGNEIVNCSVGKARNRGIAEASLRFHENGKNGVIINTDADTYFDDRNYFVNLRNIINKNRNFIGISGGLKFEFSPDNTDEERIEALTKKVGRLVLLKKWSALNGFIMDFEYFRKGMYQTWFAGAHMITRSFESAVVGGLPGENALEDVVFGLELENYGADKGQIIVGARNDLFLVTALRESNRTAVSFGKEFDRINVDEPLMVHDPFVFETFIAFEDRMTSLLNNEFDQKAFRTIVSDKNGNLLIRENFFNALIPVLKSKGKFPEQASTIVKTLYNTCYPKIQLTEEVYNGWASKIASESKEGFDLITFIDNMTVKISNNLCKV